MTICRLLVGIIALSVSDAMGADAFWEYAPYRIRVLLDVDRAPGTDQPPASRLVSYITNRCIATAGPIWRVTIVPAKLTPRWFAETAPDDTSEPFPSDWEEVDKLVLLRVSRGTGGFRASAREFDVSTRRWGTVVDRKTRQRGNVYRTIFSAMRWAVSPIATFRVDREDRRHVRLSARGKYLLANADDFRRISAGDVLIPVFRKNDRDGHPRPGGIQQVPWTYLVVDPIEKRVSDDAVLKGDSSEMRCTVFSGTRRPFGARRRGRIEQFAIVARPPGASIKLRLVSRLEDQHPLAGCRIYERNADKSFFLVGVSDSNGQIRIERSDAPVRVLWIKSGNLLIAKAPIVPGLAPSQTFPLPDDESRLEIEGELTALRNELVDSVARRQILAARFRASLATRDFTEARSLLEQMESLPTRTQFSQRISRQERDAKADDPQTQARIKKIFSDTKIILGKFLDQREISKLHDLLNQATREAPAE